MLGALLALLPLLSCQSEAERLQAESLFHLENVVKILEATAGNTDAAVAELDKYLVEHRTRLLEVRALGSAMLRRMSPDERVRFQGEAMERARPLRERVETLAGTFPDPPRIFQKVRQFL